MNPFLNYPNEEMLSAPFENSFLGNGTVRFKFSIGFAAWFDVAYKIKNRLFVPDTGTAAVNKNTFGWCCAREWPEKRNTVQSG